MYDVGAEYVPVEVLVPRRFEDLKANPPKVKCLAQWMKCGAEWHNDEYLCWVMPDEWKDTMQISGARSANIIDLGVRWFHRDVKCLINRHLYAHLSGISSWPSNWDAWPHFEVGREEYRRTR